MAKYRRQPKAGDLARKPSAPFAIRPKVFQPDNFAPALARTAPASEREATVYPANMRITYCPPTWARGARKPLKGGMMGGATGCCRGVTSCNGMGVVPAAFNK